MGLQKTTLFVLVFLALFSSRTFGQEHTLVRFSFGSGWYALPAVVAVERGFFAQEGLVVSGLASSSGPAVINALNAGSTDFAEVPQRVLLVMAAAEVPVKVIAMSGWGTEMELVAKVGVPAESITDLKGKRIAVLFGSEAFPVLVRLLNRARLRPTDVEITQLSASDLTQAFQKDLAEAVFETRHFTSVLVQNGQARVVIGSQDVSKALGVISGIPLVARTAEIENNPETVQKFVTAWVKALKYIEQDPDDVARLLQIFFHRQGVKATTRMARSWVEMIKYNEYAWSPNAVADAEYNGWGLNIGGILKVAPKLTGYIDNRFVEKAVKIIAAP